MKLKLHKPHGKNHWCGPTALSAVSGISTDDASALARLYSGRRYIKGMTHGELGSVIRQLGGSMSSLYVGPGQTLTEWLEGRAENIRQQVLIVCVTDHYVVALRDTVVCSGQRREAKHYLSAYSARQQVKKAWIVTMPAKVKLPAVLGQKRQQAKRRASANDLERARAHSLAKELRLKLKRYDEDTIDIRVDDAAWWGQRLGLPADADTIEDVIADQCRTSGDDWSDVITGLKEIKAYMLGERD